MVIEFGELQLAQTVFEVEGMKLRVAGAELGDVVWRWLDDVGPGDAAVGEEGGGHGEDDTTDSSSS